MPASQIAKQVGRRAFGLDPAAYHSTRPDYPEWVYRTLHSQCSLGPGATVFEIGAGTGKASRRVLDLGADPLIAIEPDARLADFLRKITSDRALQVLVSTFEDAELEASAFDLGVSATAFHWLDEQTALRKIVRLLRPGGWWAAFWNVFGDDSRPDPFHEATKKLLEGPSSPSAGEHGIPFGLDAEARSAALKRTDAFDIIDVRTSRWSLALNADQAMALYGTYSNINVRADRDALLAELGRIVRDEFRGCITRNMTTSLYIARRTA
jgi:SAM-dependent methyltransferase